MAGKSIGALSIDLVAKVGGFISGLDKAARSSAAWRNQIMQSMTVASKAAGAASAIVNGAMAVWIKSSINSAAELKNFAQLANSSTTEFQKFAAGARTVGIDNEKLADIFKDVNDKVGEFLTTGGGELKDFFDVVAPKAGVTADQFRNLSGPQALGLFVDTLERAGANRQEMTFFMEALADDATALIPLLQNGGKGMRDLASEAENLGLILSEETIRGAKQFNDDLDLLGRVANGVGQQIAAELLPELLELTNELRDPETAKAATTMAKAVVESFSTITAGARETVGFIKWAAESAAAFMNGAAGDDIVRLEDQLKDQERAYAKFKNLYQDPVLPDGKVAGWLTGKTKDEHEAAIAATKAQIDSYWKLQGLLNNPPKIDPPKTSGKSGGGIGLNIDTSAGDKAKAAAKAAADAERDAEKVREDSLRAYMALSEEVAGVVSGTWSEQSQAMAEYQGRVETLHKGVLAGIISEDDANASIALLDKTLSTQLDHIQEAQEKLKDEQSGFWDKWLKAAEGNLSDFDEMTSDTLKSFSLQFGSAFESMIFDSNSLGDAVQNMAEGMARSVVNSIGQIAGRWLAYKAVQLAVGEAAMARSGMEIAAITATQTASAAATAATVVEQEAAAAATTASWTPAAIAASIGSFGTAAAIGLAAVVAAMAFTGFRKGGYTGSGGVDEVAGVVHGQEFVFDAASTARIGVANLEAMRTGRLNKVASSVGGGAGSVSSGISGGSSQVIHQTITVNGDASQQTIQAVRQAAQQGAQQALSAIVSDANRNGPIIQTIRKRI